MGQVMFWVGFWLWLVGMVVLGIVWFIIMVNTWVEYHKRYSSTDARDVQNWLNRWWHPVVWPAYFGVVGWRAWRSFREDVARVDAARKAG